MVLTHKILTDGQTDKIVLSSFAANINIGIQKGVFCP